MDVELSNCAFVQPFVDVVILEVTELTFLVPRNAVYTYVTITEDKPATNVVLKKAPLSTKWVEVWLDGFRVFNPSLDFGATHTVFEIVENVIQFHNPIFGNLKIICDQFFPYDLGTDYLITPNTVQGASAVNTVPGTVVAGYFCEPIILTQPVHGYVRLTDDFLSLIYVPALNYVGNDSFSYSVYTDRGQIATPKCVQIKVDKLVVAGAADSTTPTDPTDPTTPTPPTTPVDPTANDS